MATFGKFLKDELKHIGAFLEFLDAILKRTDLIDSLWVLHTLTCRCAEDARPAEQLMHAVDTCSRRHLLQHPAPLLVLQHGAVCPSAAGVRCLSEEHGLPAWQAQCGSVGPHLSRGSVAPFLLSFCFWFILHTEGTSSVTRDFVPEKSVTRWSCHGIQ